MKSIFRLLILFIINICLPTSLFSQDMFDESLATLEKFNNVFVDETGSFLDDPYNHNNTLRVFEKMKEFNEIYKELQSKKYEVLSRWDNSKTRKYYDSVDKMHAIAEAFEELLRKGEARIWISTSEKCWITATRSWNGSEPAVWQSFIKQNAIV